VPYGFPVFRQYVQWGAVAVVRKVDHLRFLKEFKKVFTLVTIYPEMLHNKKAQTFTDQRFEPGTEEQT